MRRPGTLIRMAVTTVVVAGAAIAVGLAAGLTTLSNNIGAAQAATPRCTGSDLSVIEGTGATITTVTLSSSTNIDNTSACHGASLAVTVTNGTTSGSATCTIGTAPCTVAGTGPYTFGPLTLSAGVARTAATQADIVMTGP
ncbi:MAG TPA: hypothetical protein VEK76_13135 [Candidatus Binatia bacterium]|nr:hypothetical protein [Candidatus Binatia bacterium]